MAPALKMLEKHRASMKIDESISSSFKIVDYYMKTIDLNGVLAMSEERAETDIFFSQMKTYFYIHRALFTFDEVDLDKIPREASKTIDLCNRYRRKGFFGSLLGIFKTPDYDKYEEIEIHAEMIYAVIVGMSAVMGLIRCSKFVDFLKMINRLWLANKALNETKQMFKRRKHWESEKSRLDFEAAIRLERGFRNIIISYCSPKLLRLINFLGLKGRRGYGFSQLNKCAFELSGINSIMSEFCILSYWMYVETHASLGPKNLNLCEKVINKGLEVYPTCFFYKFFSNKLIQLKGNIDLSIEKHKELLLETEKRNYLYPKICQWEMMWSYALLCDWDNAIKYANMVRMGAKHSPAIFAYLEAMFRYVKGKEENNDQLIEEATKLFQLVPTLRIRYLGKTVTYEKACVDSAKLFFRNNNFLLFPVMDMFYNGNLFYLIDGNIELLERFMVRVDKEVDTYVRTLDSDKYIDNYLNAIFYRGVLFRYMGKLAEAKRCFKIILKEKNRLESLLSIAPQSLMELGIIEMSFENFDESKQIFNKVLNEYSNYVSEHIVHIRCYSALRQMGVNTDKENECEVNIMKEYANTWLMTGDDTPESEADELIQEFDK